MISISIAEYLQTQPLSPETLLLAYRTGWFPMGEPDSADIYWHSPDPRAIFPLDGVKISRSLRQTINKGHFEFRFDTAFEDVIRACADRPESWITEDIIASYCALHYNGWAHSVETWHEGVLVGGLYGVAVGGAYFGESMFSTMRDASKAAFAVLTEHLRDRNFLLLDSQYINPFTQSLGAIEISREHYLELLGRAVVAHCIFK
jgi:leucyl/phenylalanyl-tRNA--protein transferase